MILFLYVISGVVLFLGFYIEAKVVIQLVDMVNYIRLTPKSIRRHISQELKKRLKAHDRGVSTHGF